MNNNVKNILKLSAISAVGITCLGYLLDSDPPYENVWHTVLEFSIIAIVLFVFFSLLALGLYFASKRLFSVQKKY